MQSQKSKELTQYRFLHYCSTYPLVTYELVNASMFPEQLFLNGQDRRTHNRWELKVLEWYYELEDAVKDGPRVNLINQNCSF